MMKRIHKSILSTVTALIMLTALCLLLTACGCKHEWKDTPNAHSQTCALCGEIQLKDEACKWVDATCESPKTCSVCNKTEGEALGHTWADATCENPKTCSACKKTEGEALGHTWVDATTEAPKTCSVCEKTEGERIITDPRFTTAACKDLFGEWKGTMNLTGAQINVADFTGTMGVTYTITFNPDGTFKENIALSDKAAFLNDLEVYYENTLYVTFAGQGLNKEQADAAMKAQYGMDVKAYSKVLAVAIDWDAMLAESANSGVYYVSGGKLCSGQGWSEPIGRDNYTLEDGKLTLESLTQSYPGLVFTRVTK